VTPGVCRILNGVCSVARTGMPVGRQRAPGSSLLLVARRSSKIRLPSGVNGTVSPFFMPCARSTRIRGAIQIPDKSGLPSAARGTAADASKDPSAFRGMPGVLYPCHCANTGDRNTVTAIAAAVETCRPARTTGTPARRHARRGPRRSVRAACERFIDSPDGNCPLLRRRARSSRRTDSGHPAT
jgi:hypothetical protein